MVYILSAKRTPIGAFLKTFVNYSAVDLGAVAIKSAIQSANIATNQIQDVIMGQVLTAGCGQNPVRQSALKVGIPNEVPALTINQVCASGLRAVILGTQAIKDGLDCVVVGGQESMTNSHFSAHYDRKSKDEKDSSILKDTMIVDGLWCAMNDYHMGITAENLAQKYNISRTEQDEFAYQSQMKTKTAQQNGHFANEIVSSFGVEEDMYARNNVSVADLAELKPVFKPDGTVTAGNASGINDGAVGIVLASEDFVKNNNAKPMAKIVAYGVSGVDPAIMGIAPATAVKKALASAGWSIGDLDLIESNEAFASQAIAVNKELAWDTNKVNISGGAIALGHPIGASGARILTTLVHALHRQNKKRGIATLCVGGGQGVAVCIEAL